MQDDIPTTARLWADTLRRRWPLWVSALVVVPSLALVVSDMMPKKYVATTKIFINDAVMLAPAAARGEAAGGAARFQLIKEVLTSQPLLTRCLRQWGRLRAQYSSAEVEQAVEQLRQNLEVVDLGRGLITCKLTGPSAHGVTRGLQELVNTLEQEVGRLRREALAEQTSLLEKQLERLRAEISELDEKMGLLKYDPTAPENLSGAQLTAMGDEMQALLRKRSTLLARLRAFDPEAADVEKELAQTHGQLRQLRATYTERHPDVMAAQARLNQLREQLALRREGGPALHRLLYDNPRYVELLRELDGVHESIQSYEQRVRTRLGRHESVVAAGVVTLNQLARDSAIKNDAYRAALQQYEAALRGQQPTLYDGHQIWVVEPVVKPTASSNWPLWGVGLVATVGGFLLGLLLCALADAIWQPVRRPSEVFACTGIRVVACLPRLK